MGSASLVLPSTKAMSLRLTQGITGARLALALVPLATSLAYTSLVLAMTVQQGHLPQFNDPSAPFIGFPLELIFILGTPSSLTLAMVWLVISPSKSDADTRSLAAQANTVFWAGLALLTLILATDPGGVIEWILD